MKKAIIIIPYFGDFPIFFEDFLNSCKYNPDYDWLIYTDNKNSYRYPSNVRIRNINFNDFIKIIQSKFDFKIEIKRPHKLCDFKVAYGYIFEDEIREYKYWAHGDLDVIYGNLNNFTDCMLNEEYDKIFSLGHLSFYKNSYAINRIFMNKINNIEVYKRIFSTDKAFAFDEWHCLIGSINHLFINENMKFMPINYCANLDSAYNGFRLTNYDLNFDNYVVDINTSNIFKFINGRIIRYYMNFNELKHKEYPYLHFHKRKVIRKSNNYEEYIIKPNEIIDSMSIDKNLVTNLSKVNIINLQYFKVRLINLRYKLKHLEF